MLKQNCQDSNGAEAEHLATYMLMEQRDASVRLKLRASLTTNLAEIERETPLA